MIAAQQIRQIVGEVPDPELPAMGIGELGIVRDVQVDDERVTVVLTPTYTGCPAIEAMESDIRSALGAAGVAEVRFQRRLAPPWTTDWMSGAAREKLRRYGIAPPAAPRASPVLITLGELAASATSRREPAPACPQCGSTQTEQISSFGASACTAQWRCQTCREPFDHFKTLRADGITDGIARAGDDRR